MKEFSVSLKERLRRLGYVVLFCVLAMSALSVLTLLSGVDRFGTRRIIIQSVAITAGLLLMIFISLFDYDAFVSKLVIPFFVVSIIALIIVNIFGQGEGQKNWIRIPGIPFDIQPSEFVKILFVITFSKHIDRLKHKINKISSVFQLAIHAGIIIGLLLLTGDLGSTLVYICAMAGMLLVSGLSLWYFIGVGILLVVAIPYVWPLLDTYQQERILVGFNPELDPLDKGYQAIYSKRAIASGGFRGAGFSGGTVYKSLPIAESDFLFSVLCEKFGFFGAFTYMIFMAALIIRLIYIAKTARKDYGAYICVGVVSILIAQTVENIGMCLAMLPVIGITLPFFSYGGSSMLSLYISIGVIQSIYTHNKKYYFERELA